MSELGLADAPSTAPAPTGDRRRRGLVRLALGVALLLLGLALVMITRPSGGAAAGEIFLEASDLPGSATFTPSIAEPPPPAPAPSATAVPEPSPGGLVRSDAASPGLYGGVRNAPSCRTRELVGALTADPVRARAWAGVVGIAPSDIGAYVDTLTPALLRVDTRVTDWSFARTRAVSRQAILQAGTAVLLDRSVAPRVRCASGNPLGEPQAVSVAPRYSGPRWPAFRPNTVVVVTPAPQPPPVIVLIDINTGLPFSRIPGSIVIIDIDRLGPGIVVAVAEPGGPVTITGARWPPGALLTLVFDNPVVTLGTVTADGAGAFSVVVRVPEGAAPGVHQVRISGGGFALDTPVYVVPRVPTAVARTAG